MTAIQRLVPFPGATVVLLVVWLALVNSVEPGQIVLGLILGVAIPHFTRIFSGHSQPVKRPGLVARLLLLFLLDVVRSNLSVAAIVLFRRNAHVRPAFLSVPLDISNPTAITVFASMITMTPGTVSADLDRDGGCLLVHALDPGDPDAAVEHLKSRYEAVLKEIFE